MNVGITIKTSNSIFSNGLVQNAIFLYDVLKKIDLIKDVFLIVFDADFNDTKEQYEYLKGYKVIRWDKAVENTNILITMGIMPNYKDLKYFKSKKNTKVIGYKGGNNLILSTEDLLFERKWQQVGKEIKKDIAYPDNKDIYDEIWMVPQQEYHNKDYFEITYGCPAITIPFIWSPKFIEDEVSLKINQSPEFKIYFKDKEFEKWRVAAMEPNTSILKNMMPILHSMEWAYTQDSSLFQQFNITNASEFRNHPILITIAKALEINKTGKLGFDPRWSVVTLLGLFAEMIISHQWGNPLNYAYLDVVYYGYPLVHNASMCQDIGYYYPDFELKKAGDLIVYAAKNHKDDLDYMDRNRKIISRYTSHNQALINQYSDLIEGLFDSSKKPIGSYNWKTNLIE